MAASNRIWNEPLLASKSFYHGFESYFGRAGNATQLLKLIDELRTGDLSPGRNMESIVSGLLSFRIDGKNRLLGVMYQGYLILQELALEHDYEKTLVFRERYKLDNFIKSHVFVNVSNLEAMRLSEEFLQPYYAMELANTPQKKSHDVNTPLAPQKPKYMKDWDEAVKSVQQLAFFSQEAEEALFRFFNRYNPGVAIQDAVPVIISGDAGSGKTYHLLALLAWRMMSNPNKQFVVVSPSEERSRQLTAIWKEHMGDKLDEYPVQFKPVFEYQASDSHSSDIFVVDAQKLDEVFLTSVLSSQTMYSFNKNHVSTVDKMNRLKQTYFNETKQPMQVLDFSQNFRSSLAVLNLKSKFSQLQGIASGLMAKTSDNSQAPKAPAVGECQWVDLEDVNNMNSHTKNIVHVITDETHIEEAQHLFPDAQVLTPKQAVEGHVVMDSVIFYKLLASPQAIAADRVIKIQQSPNSSPKSKQQNRMEDTSFFDEVIQTLGLVKKNIVMVHSQTDRKKAEQLFDALNPIQVTPAANDKENIENIILAPPKPKAEIVFTPVSRRISPNLQRLIENYSRENLETLMSGSERMLIEIISNRYEVHGINFHFVEQIRTNTEVFNDFFKTLLTNQNLFFKFPIKELLLEFKKNNNKGDLAYVYSNALFQIKALIKNQGALAGFTGSFPELVILFLAKEKRFDLIEAYLALLIKIDDPSILQTVVLRIMAKNDPKLFKLLEHLNYDFKSFQKDGKNLLHYAVQSGSTQLIERLIHHEVDLTQHDNEGRKPFDLIAKQNKSEMAILSQKFTPVPSLASQSMFTHPVETPNFISEVLSDDEFNHLINQ